MANPHSPRKASFPCVSDLAANSTGDELTLGSQATTDKVVILQPVSVAKEIRVVDDTSRSSPPQYQVVNGVS
jgi:hypothetical protein